MLPEHPGGTVAKFDEAMLEALRELPDVKVFESVRPDEDRSGNTYLVYSGGDIVPGASTNHEPITGFSEASVLHSFSVFIAAPTAGVRRAVQKAVRRIVLGFRLEGCTPPRETGQLNSYGDSDQTIKPVRYTALMTYQSTIDRSV